MIVSLVKWKELRAIYRNDPPLQAFLEEGHDILRGEIGQLSNMLKVQKNGSNVCRVGDHEFVGVLALAVVTDLNRRGDNGAGTSQVWLQAILGWDILEVAEEEVGCEGTVERHSMRNM